MAAIGKDLIASARECAGKVLYSLLRGTDPANDIALAISAERQRCAALTEKYRERPIGDEARLVASYINREITNP